jgi:formyltetrahydrofolate synthetase
MQMLKANEIDIESAKAQANLLKQSNNILKYELDKAIAIAKFEHIEIKDIED